ncbi:MAG: hypothetical protein U0L34_06475, partial [Paludibacteraceae bacterium]|nr:hypothetical protein [Paludibacteraceae bacterium]
MRITNLCQIIGIAINLLACQTTEQNPPKPTETQVVMVGNDRDKHGCKASAGYIWSELKGECVRIWEVGSKLMYTQANHPNEVTTFVVFSTDSTQLETFGSNPQIWTRTEGTASWTSADKKQILEHTQQGWILK